MSKILKVVGASWLQTKISSYILALLGVISILSLILGQIERIQGDGNYAATVFFTEKTGYRLELWGQGNELADVARGVARAYLREDVNTNGWILLEVETDGSYPDEVQAYAAGLVEGTLTWSLIHTHLENTIRAECEGRNKQCDKLRDALDKSALKWKSYAAEHRATDPFWHQVSLYYSQIAGIYTGWEHGIRRNEKDYKTDVSDLYWLNSVSEVTELQRKLNISVEDDTFSSLPGLSSAYLRIVNQTSEDGLPLREIYVAQNGAGSYSSMIRLMKRYKLNYHLTTKDSSPVRGTVVDFAGYPGSVTSQDELYVVQGEQLKMAVTGTKLRNYNNKLWKNVNITDQVPIGARVTAANHLAANISSWGHILARSNSGTACKQWLVVDYNRFHSVFNVLEKSSSVEKKEVITETMFNDTKHTVVHRAGSGRAKGLVGLIEQIPGRTHSADISDAFVENTYWATHGLPFFKDIAEATHVTKMQEIYGNMFSESQSPRAELFQIGHKNASTVDTILELMRSNDIVAGNTSSSEDCNDEMCLLLRGYWSVLGVRGDILEQKKAFGVIDTKVVKVTWNNSKLEFVAVSGPPNNAISKEDMLVNRGNVASVYTDQFDDAPTISGLEIRALVKQQKEQAEMESLRQLNKYTVKPFKWSESAFQNKSHERLPDLWDFEPYHPNWSW